MPDRGGDASFRLWVERCERELLAATWNYKTGVRFVTYATVGYAVASTSLHIFEYLGI